MARIVPIRGVRYSNKAGRLTDLIAPPYDVIDEQAQRLLYEKSKYNVIRLEYGETRATDDKKDNRYTRAAAFFSRWLAEGVLVHEKAPSIYLYEQAFTLNGERLVRSGLICGVVVEDFSSGMILPHEDTLARAKADRLELLRAAQANFSPIFGLYDDPSFTVEQIATRYKQNTAILDFTDENGENHRLWVVDDEGDLANLKAFFLDKKIFIADGHHRYETALHFHREMQSSGRDDFGFTLMALVNLHDPGLVILPTHRLLKNVASDLPSWLPGRLSAVFQVSHINLSSGREKTLALELEKMREVTALEHAFLLYCGDGRLYRVRLPRGSKDNEMALRCGSCSPSWRALDVVVLQYLIMEDMLGIDRDALQRGVSLAYTREEAGALSMVDSGEFQAVFFMNPTPVREVIKVAAAGERMPQKSTYFFPKLITGLVINDFTVK